MDPWLRNKSVNVCCQVSAFLIGDVAEVIAKTLYISHLKPHTKTLENNGQPEAVDVGSGVPDPIPGTGTNSSWPSNRQVIESIVCGKS